MSTANAPDCLLDLLRRPHEPAAMVAYADSIERRDPARAREWRLRAVLAEPDDRRLAAGYLGALVADHLPFSAHWFAIGSPVLADDPAAAVVMRETAALFPPPDVTVFVIAQDAAATIAAVLSSLADQTCPASRVVVIDCGSVDATAALAATAGVEVARLPREAGRVVARQAALQLAETELLAYLDADIVPAESWLEELYLHLARPAMLLGETDTVAPLGVVFGAALELCQSTVPELWQARHTMPYFAGRQTVDEVPWLYGGNLMASRAALQAVGGWAVSRAKVADLLLSVAIRGAGYRIAFCHEARGWRYRPADLPQALDSAVGHQTSFVWQQSNPQFESGGLPGLLAQLPATIERWRLERVIDQTFHQTRLAYPTFCLLPWLIFADFGLAAALAEPAEATVIRQTHAAVWLGLFPVLSSLGAPAGLLDRLAVDLAAAAPDDPELRELCGPAGAQAQQAAASAGFNPIDMLTRHDREAMVAHLRAMAAELTFDDAEWQRLLDAADSIAVPDAGERVAVVCLPPGGPETPPADGRAVLRALRAAGCDAREFTPLFDRVELCRAIAVWDPARVVLVCPPEFGDAWTDMALHCREAMPATPLEIYASGERPPDWLAEAGITWRAEQA